MSDVNDPVCAKVGFVSKDKKGFIPIKSVKAFYLKGYDIHAICTESGMGMVVHTIIDKPGVRTEEQFMEWVEKNYA